MILKQCKCYFLLIRMKTSKPVSIVNKVSLHNIQNVSISAPRKIKEIQKKLFFQHYKTKKAVIFSL